MQVHRLWRFPAREERNFRIFGKGVDVLVTGDIDHHEGLMRLRKNGSN